MINKITNPAPIWCWIYFLNKVHSNRNMAKSILIGLHNQTLKRVMIAKVQSCSYSIVDHTDDPREMIYHAQQREYGCYIMDLNLGKPRSVDIAPAVAVYDIIRERVNAGRAKFVGISGNSDTVRAARKKGIPAYMGLANLDDFLK